MKRFANQGSVVDYYEANAEFHLEIIRTSGSKSLVNIYDSICKQVSLFRKTSLSLPGRLNISLQQHQEILAALLSGDGEKAGTLLKLHVLDAGHTLVSALSKTKPGNKVKSLNLTRREA
jgi:DNA-binding GntR family transcriptional regulator